MLPISTLKPYMALKKRRAATDDSETVREADASLISAATDAVDALQHVCQQLRLRKLESKESKEQVAPLIEGLAELPALLEQAFHLANEANNTSSAMALEACAPVAYPGAVEGGGGLVAAGS